MSLSKVLVLSTVPKGSGSWREKLRRTSMLVDRASDGLIFVNFNMVEVLGYYFALKWSYICGYSCDRRVRL